jgi:hypothetical protein
MSYYASELNLKNLQYPWINTSQVKAENPHKKYELHATGDATLQSGRIYVAVPTNVKLTDEVKKRLNIM